MNASPDLPDEVIAISDDAEAQALMMRCGMLDKFPSKDLLPFGLSAACLLDHPTHWILGTRWHGNPNPKENGYGFFGWPKKQFPKSVIQAQLRRFGMDQPDGSIVHRKGDCPPPRAN